MIIIVYNEEMKIYRKKFVQGVDLGFNKVGQPPRAHALGHYSSVESWLLWCQVFS